jgi:ATP-dependent helicase HrpB
MLQPLAIDGYVEVIRAAVAQHSAAVVVAPPGAGKTTRVPPALLDAGKLILLQPRRVAARSLARRIASEQGWTLGREIGWHIRFERRFSKETRLIVATEGILTARLQSDPLLEEFATVVLDEFHERSVDLDLAIAFLKQAGEARPDLRVVVMSATIAAGKVAEWLGGAPVIEVDARTHPVEISWARRLPGGSPGDSQQVGRRLRADLPLSRPDPALEAAQAVREVFATAAGDILVFLPGAAEIDRAVRSLSDLDADILPLHGMLDSDAQDRALAPSPRRKVIVATNIAETSLTVEGVTDVIDSGLHRILRYDPARGVDALVTERIPRDSADQRAGRAGRTRPGRALRLWGEHDVLRDHRQPEIHRVDLAPVLLSVIAWGGDPLRFPWFDPPPAHRVEHGLDLLARLRAIDPQRKITADGRILARLPLHPRLGRVLLSTNAAPEAARMCALLASGRGRVESDAPRLREGAARLFPVTDRDDEAVLRKALFEAYSDRLARRRGNGYLMASGFGARLAPECHAGTAEWIVALDADTSTRGGTTEALIRSASVVDRGWVEPNRIEIGDEISGASPRRVERRWYDAILISARNLPLTAAEAAALAAPAREARLRELASGAEPAAPEEGAGQLLRRLQFAALPIDFALLASNGGAVDGRTRRELEKLAPERIALPSGRTAKLHYRADGSVVVEAKLQELFGLAETPLLGPARIPLTFVLLSPSGGPVQTTRDLRSFWERGYQEVRRELRGRYPKHPWPEDPWTAIPTARAKRRP